MSLFNPHVHVHRERETYMQTQTHIAYISLWYICPKICWCWCGLSRFFSTHPKPQLCEARMYREDSQLSRLDAWMVFMQQWWSSYGLWLPVWYVDFVSTTLDAIFVWWGLLILFGIWYVISLLWYLYQCHCTSNLWWLRFHHIQHVDAPIIAVLAFKIGWVCLMCRWGPSW